METVKKIGILFLIGFVLGTVLASVIAPSMLAWYNTGADVNAMCNCSTVAKATSSQLIRSQGTGGVVGGVLMVILGLIIARARAQGAASAAASTAGTTPKAS